MDSLKQRITVNPEQCGGQPCIRGMFIRLVDILDLLSTGLTFKEIIQEMPDLEFEDIKSAVSFARNRLNHPVIVI